MRAPSGDHSKAVTPDSLFVKGVASPPSGRIAKIWFLSSVRALVKPIHWLSGDHCTLPADLAPRVNWMGVPPLDGTSPQLRHIGVLLEVGFGDAVGNPASVR